MEGIKSTEAAEFLRTNEVANLLHVSPKTISRWASEHKLPFVRTLGGHRRFPAQEIRDLADRLSGGVQVEQASSR